MNSGQTRAEKHFSIFAKPEAKAAESFLLKFPKRG